MQPIPDMRENITDDIPNNCGDDDDRNRSGEIKRLDNDRCAYHVGPEAEIDERLRPSEGDKNGPDEMHAAHERTESEPCFGGNDVMIHDNRIVMWLLISS